MISFDKTLKRFLRKWPGKRWLGNYRFVPAFFVFGAALEFCMIKWHVGETNFYKVYKRREVERIVSEKLQEEILLKNQKSVT